MTRSTFKAFAAVMLLKGSASFWFWHNSPRTCLGHVNCSQNPYYDNKHRSWKHGESYLGLCTPATSDQFAPCWPILPDNMQRAHTRTNLKHRLTSVSNTTSPCLHRETKSIDCHNHLLRVVRLPMANGAWIHKHIGTTANMFWIPHVSRPTSLIPLQYS